MIQVVFSAYNGVIIRAVVEQARKRCRYLKSRRISDVHDLNNSFGSWERLFCARFKCANRESAATMDKQGCSEKLYKCDC